MTETTRGRVLLVDDDHNALAGLEALLEDEFDVVATDGIPGARTLLDRQIFDVVVSDYQLPGGTGLDVLRYARERLAKVIGIVWTGRADLAYARAQAESFRVIPKSEAPDLLLLAVRQSVALVLLRSSMATLRR